MSSKVIKFVAGGGKTTLSIDYMKSNTNGLYLAFNNQVVNMIKYSGFLSKTIDSLFQSFIIPKFITEIPLIGSNKIIKYLDVDELPDRYKNILNIKIDASGNIYNKNKKKLEILFTLNNANKDLHKSNFTNSTAIKYIFGKEELRLTDSLRSDLAEYIINKYPNEIIEIMKNRFSYVIFDEAQDLSGWREKFAILIVNSDINVIVLGDDNQNINNGGVWFENLIADEVKNNSFRCPDNNCKWIREHIKIEIYGNENASDVIYVNQEDVGQYDDGNRVLLYYSRNNATKNIIDNWQGDKMTIKSSKGQTICKDVVIIGKSSQYRFLYTAMTRTTKNIYTTISEKNIKFDK